MDISIFSAASTAAINGQFAASGTAGSSAISPLLDRANSRNEETVAVILSSAPPLVLLWRPLYPVFQALRNMDLAAPRETPPHGEIKRPEKRDGDNVASSYSLEKLHRPSRCQDIALNSRSEPKAADKARGFVPP